MRSWKFIFVTAVVLFIGGIWGCVKKPGVPPPPPSPPAKKAPTLVQISHSVAEKLLLIDDGTLQSLEEAVKKSIEYMERLPEEQSLNIPGVGVKIGEYKKGLYIFLECLQKNSLDTENILRIFDLYMYSPYIDSPSNNHSGRALVTGYYEPIIQGSLQKSGNYSYPVYPVPEDLLRVSLSDFGITCSERNILSGRIVRKKFIPYFSRQEIDEGALQDLHPLFWANDPVEVFFLHIQGSGVVTFPDGSMRRIGYAASNGRSYRSIGKYMIEKNYIPEGGMSMQAITAFLKKHPGLMREIFWHNESYVFFQWVESGPKGSLNVILTPERSVASDRRYYPAGALSYLSTLVPKANGGVKAFRRWVLHQDAGGAIKGPNRIDLFFGTGNEAGERAGRMKHHGTLILLLPKDVKPVNPSSL